MKWTKIPLKPYPNVKAGGYVGVSYGYGSKYYLIKRISRKRDLIYGELREFALLIDKLEEYDKTT